jgi:hypothetical protein
MGSDIKLLQKDEPSQLAWMHANVAIPAAAVSIDAASVLYVDDAGKRFRLPKGRGDLAADGTLGRERMMREVCTERDLLNCAGTFFEVPAENAGGVAKIRPIATHQRRIHDFASWRGLLVMSGVALSRSATNRHIIRSDDGKAAVWVGAVDDLWNLGKAVGQGGPWKDTVVSPAEPSDAYLMTGYDGKSLTLSHQARETVRMRLEVDLTGTGKWVTYDTFVVPAGQSVKHRFPDGYQAYWLRVVSDVSTTATAWLVYD